MLSNHGMVILGVIFEEFGKKYSIFTKKNQNFQTQKSFKTNKKI